MGPELEFKARPDSITALCVKENGGLSVDSENEYLKCESNCEDHALEMDVSVTEPLLADRNKDVEVNVIESTTSDVSGLVETEAQDATESLSSSSFDDTVSGAEDAANTSDAEVGSDLQCLNSSPLAINGFGDVPRMRKKKLTSHWRTFIQPLMWRCKWVELQVRKLSSQALMYDRELANYNQRKHLLLEDSPEEGFGMKSLPFPCDGPTDKVLKRKKRRRIEDTTDVASYMAHHNLFSYFGNRIRTADGAYVDDDWGNQVNSTDKINDTVEFEVNDERLWLESMGGANSSEEVLRKIGLLESQVSKLKSRLGKVMNENAGKFSSADNLGLLVPSSLTSSARSPASPPNNGDRTQVGTSNIASQIMSRYNVGNVVMPEGAISSHGEVSFVPDIMEGTDQCHLGAACIKTEDQILIYDERLKEQRSNFDEVTVPPMQKPQVAKEEPESTFKSDLHPDDQPAAKVRSLAKLTAPKSRRKRGRRKAGSSRWSRRSSG